MYKYFDRSRGGGPAPGTHSLAGGGLERKWQLPEQVNPIPRVLQTPHLETN